MDVLEDATEFDVDEIPPGCILVRQEDGMYSFVKLEPLEQEEIIEEVENFDIEGAEVEQEEVIDDLELKNLSRVSGAYLALPEEQTLDELDIEDIPDIIEEELSPGSFDHTATDAQIEFVGASADPDFDALSINVSTEKKPKKLPPPGPVSWKGLTIPPGLSSEEVERFKGKHALLKLSEQVKRNKSKVEIYSKKNDELKRLIGTQRDQMTRMGFPLKEIARFHCHKRKPRAFPRPLPPVSEQNPTFGVAYKAKRLQAEYTYYRKCLKAVLSSHRRYKKIFVENHEKMQKGHLGKAYSSTMPLVKAVPQVTKHPFHDDSDSEQDGSGGNKASKIFKCYHCSYSAMSKSALVPHIQNHLVSPKMYNCPECPYSTPKVTQFLEHMKLHPGAKAFKCDHCAFKTAHPSALKNHKSLHMAVKPYKCPLCSLRFGRSDHLRNHMRCHSNNRGYKCEACPFSSKYSSGLSNHIRRSHKKLYQQKRAGSKPLRVKAEVSDGSEDPGETTEIEVDESGKISAIRTIRKNAQDGSESDERKPGVSLRRKVKKKIMADFTDGEEFDEVFIKTEAAADGYGDVLVEEAYEESEGEVVEDEEEGVYETRVADAPGTYYEDVGEDDDDDDEQEDENEQDDDDASIAESQVPLERETKRKDLLSSYVIYQCVWCDFSCEMKNALLDHLSTHMTAWTFTCKVCNFVARTPPDLKVHTDEHKNKGEFDCLYCDYVTESRLKLRSHVAKRHPPGKPMSCVHCDYITSSRLAMKNHMFTHKSRKMWQCTMCEYKAPFRSSLKRHIRKHTGERPYFCPHCEFNAAQYSHLTRHLRKYHPEEPPILENRPPSPFVPIF